MTRIATLALVAVALCGSDYDRRDWKHWVDADRDCQSTRQEVLLAEAIGAVALARDGCTVVSGRWLDPYTGETFTDPRKLDVDHLVPLKNAHESGGWAWDAETRKRYANDLDDPDHLVAVSARANRAKGAKGPDEWMPPNRAYHCAYLRAWLDVKSRWGLWMRPAEARVIFEGLEACE